MNKLIALLLTLVISVSLCACSVTGNSQGELEIGSNSTTQNETAETESNASQSVEITIDNWDEYFEFKPYIERKENSFGEFENILKFGDGFGVRKEYIDRIEFPASGVAVEVELGPLVVYKFEYNIKTQELTLNSQDDIKSVDDAAFFFGSCWFKSRVSDGKLDFKICSSDVALMGNYCSPQEGSHDSLGNNVQINGDICTFYAPLALEYKVLRIQGTILVNEK